VDIKMQINKFRIYKAIIAAGLAIAVAIAIATDTAIIALVAVVAAVVLAIILERTNKEIVQDERVSQINGKAATASFYGMLILAAIASLCTALFRSRLPEDVVFVGTVMGYFVCAALLLHMGLYAYFSRKL
jgi:uncharacterized membrane protein